MGCDIHAYVEKYDRTTGVWEYVPGGTPFTCTECGGTGKTPPYCGNCEEGLDEHTGERKFCHTALSTWDMQQEDCYGCALTAVGPGLEEPYDDRFYSGRDYNLFSCLANVRGESPFPDWTEERGLPDDMSEGVARSAKGWESDAHSHTWYTLDELRQKDWKAMGFDRFQRTLDRMERLGGDVRLIMWFDN